MKLKPGASAELLVSATAPPVGDNVRRLMCAEVAIDGVSLTITVVEADAFSFSVIPSTLENTNLAGLVPGSRVNVEADLISKWINHRLDRVIAQGNTSSVTMEILQKQGFIE